MDEARRRHAEEIQRKDPRAKVLELSHDSVREPWPSDRLERVFNSIVRRIYEFPADSHDFTVRKSLLAEGEILEFQRAHPRLYYVLTDRAMMRETRYRDVLKKMLLLRQGVETGGVAADERADAVATQIVVSSLRAGQERKSG
jgi:hypothetical protein